MRIAIAGAGGIGSNVAVNLVRSGVASLRLVDFDRVEAGNLNRQFYFHDQIGQLKVEALAANLRRIRPDIDIETAAIRLDKGNCLSLLGDCPLVVEGLDRAGAKKMLLETLTGSVRAVVAACGIAGSDTTGIRVRRLGTCHIVGDFVSDCAGQPLFAHKVAAVACRMTEIILHEGKFHAQR
ncbi:sulfur carrier protein ThiS adenylyltransferase ThiF [Desulfoprunum benzoelyticum]|uniref:Sulfur carrier protein ThiS adenylyltransferase n=1 Tax=Desulfoprunum benzoelyticum TaxID=1506996 RepID=A0A840V078_9BACT|nr:sulfur carrier protein ThiS adenylyltransferase ThiF [Desulfoprunum benzoelyticum]MBB5349094.1 sulfur carrier protein ThiS adenylyltransferase [Desulfoprunum benzoelyticum]MBM9530667.1 sulfur carrier protein ThiS adenylyltransferase ThiF [Desulfoprunum benzoelyticum]